MLQRQRVHYHTQRPPLRRAGKVPYDGHVTSLLTVLGAIKCKGRHWHIGSASALPIDCVVYSPAHISWVSGLLHTVPEKDSTDVDILVHTMYDVFEFSSL